MHRIVWSEEGIADCTLSPVFRLTTLAAFSLELHLSSFKLITDCLIVQNLLRACCSVLVFGVGGKDWVLVVMVVVCGMEEFMASHVHGCHCHLVRCWGMQCRLNWAITVTNNTQAFVYS